VSEDRKKVADHLDDDRAAGVLTRSESQQVENGWRFNEQEHCRRTESDAIRQYVDPGPSVPGLVTAQAAAGPEAVALVMNERALSYRELDQRANQIAHHLRSMGAGREILVGCCLERSPELAVGLLGILKAGAAYLPLDPTYPAERLAFMLGDAEAPVLLTQHQMACRFPLEHTQVVCLDTDSEILARQSNRDPGLTIRSEDLAYVIYTSGSTGRPKGVQISHGSLQNLCSWHRQAFEITARDRATQVASPSFDATGWEIWPYLTAGASVHVPEEAVRKAPVALREWLVERGITVSFLPTPLAEAVMALEWPAEGRLRLLLTGGDVLHRRPPAGLPFRLVNNYGPTEGTVVTTSGVVASDDGEGLPTIGRPIANVRVQFLDEGLGPVPMGEPGELCVAGAGLARGYLKRPELTAEKFVVDAQGERLYRTGDLVRERADGELEFLGRLDEQVKIRGFRIELHEIVAVLDKHPEVAASAVVVREDQEGIRRLVAYVVTAPGKRLESAVLSAHLARHLPEYMVPAVFVWLQELPVTANGKVDKQALPAPEESRAGAGVGTPPRSPLEQVLGEIVCELLGLEQVGVEENFFVLGGHSLLGAQLIARIRERVGVELSLRQLFDNPTLESMALAVEERLIEEISSLSEGEAERRLAALVGEKA
jgi:amino acid adenylation domain-containing protein